MATIEDVLAQVQGLGTAQQTAKATSKAAKQLAELNGKIQKQLAKQQQEYALAIQAQQAAASLQQQREQQAFQKPFTEAELTGYYNGTKTLAQIQEERAAREFRESQAQQSTQFGQTLQQNETQFNKTLQQQQQELQMNNEMEQKKLDLTAEIQRRTLQLNELDTAQKDAIARGELQLAQEIQTRKQALEEKNQQDQLSLETAQTSGFMQNGQLTEAARAARVEEALKLGQALGLIMDPTTGRALGETQEAKQFNAEMALKNTQTMGRDANGNLTDASQQWRTQSGLEYAKTAAQLAANPGDYFESAAFMRNAGVQDPMAFLREINSNGGTSVGFRAGATSLPGANSMERITQGMPVPQLQDTFTNYQMSMPQDEGMVSTDMGMNEQGSDMSGLRKMSGYETQPAPRVSQEGPSASISLASAANNGQPVSFTSSMNKPLPMGATFNAQQTAYVDPAQQRLAAFAPTFQAGAHKMKAGAMESMSPTEKALFGSAARASGINPEDWDQSYKRSRLQTGVSANAI